MSERKYRKSKRAEQEAATRDRIVEATVRLHSEVGPSRTTVKAIAEEAGVQRLTVYRHFPDERALLKACSARFLEENPPPSLDVRPGEGPEEALSRILGALYGYYEQHEALFANLTRDAVTMEGVRASMKAFQAYLEDASRMLSHNIENDGDLDAFSIARTAMDYEFWRVLHKQGFGQAEKIKLAKRILSRA